MVKSGAGDSSRPGMVGLSSMIRCRQAHNQGKFVLIYLPVVIDIIDEFLYQEHAQAPNMPLHDACGYIRLGQGKDIERLPIILNVDDKIAAIGFARHLYIARVTLIGITADIDDGLFNREFYLSDPFFRESEPRRTGRRSRHEMFQVFEFGRQPES